MLNTLAMVFLLLFLLLSFCHLYACFRLREKPRRVTKPLLMPLLLCLYLSLGKADPLIVLALLASFAGDVLLIEMKETRIKFGIASFMICQLLYAVKWAVSANWANVTIAGIVIPAALYIAVGFTVFRFVSGGKRLAGMGLPVAIYLIAISVMGFLSCQLMLTVGVWPSALIYAGSLFFLVSDTLLAIETFRSPFTHSNFWIMKTYLLAQTLIILGACI